MTKGQALVSDCLVILEASSPLCATVDSSVKWRPKYESHRAGVCTEYVSCAATECLGRGEYSNIMFMISTLLLTHRGNV